MATYQFDTRITMKPHNRDKWWIDGDLIKTMRIEADTVNEALRIYADRNNDSNGMINISNSALKRKSAMYADKPDGTAEQVGYVITGYTDFEKDDCTWSKQYVDLWIEIVKINNAFAA